MFNFNSLLEVFDKLPTEEVAHRYVASIRWKHGIVCPHCGCDRKIHSFSDGKRYKCAGYSKTVYCKNWHNFSRFANTFAYMGCGRLADN